MAVAKPWAKRATARRGLRPSPSSRWRVDAREPSVPVKAPRRTTRLDVDGLDVWRSAAPEGGEELQRPLGSGRRAHRTSRRTEGIDDGSNGAFEPVGRGHKPLLGTPQHPASNRTMVEVPPGQPPER
jgi:hypothetical protein